MRKRGRWPRAVVGIASGGEYMWKPPFRTNSRDRVVPTLVVMGRLGDARTWVLLTCGYSLALSVGLFCVAMKLDERVIAGWAAAATVFYLAVIMGSPQMLASPGRRWWFAIVALINVGLCSFGQLAGFILYGPPLLAFIALFVLPYGLSARFEGESDRRKARRLPA